MSDPFVRTVTGDLPAAALGFCQPHEHLLVRPGVPSSLDPVLAAADPKKSTEEVRAYRTAGGGSLVDAQPAGCGRMPRGLKQVSEAAGVPVIASTGFHVSRFYPAGHPLFGLSEAALAELFTSELLTGMFENADAGFSGDRTDIRAGLIKTACEAGPLSGFHRRAFSAAAGASLTSGASIMIHTDPGGDPLALFDFLTGRGLAPEKLIFCHLDRTMPENGTAEALCREGAFVEFDTVGRFKYHSDEEELRLIRQLLDAGHAGRLMLSLDTTAARMRAYGGAIGLDYLLTQFLPQMEKAGIPEGTLRQITRENPAAALRLF